VDHHVPEELRNRLAQLDEPVAPPVAAPRSWAPVILGTLVMVLVAGVGYWIYQKATAPEGLPKNLEYQPLARGDVVFTIVEKGELEAARNTEIICQVRASGRGSNAASSIKWVIEDGAKVHKGELLVELEDAGVREQLDNERIAVEEKNDLYEQAKANFKIVENENKSAEMTAVNNLEIAKIDLEKFLKAERAQKQFDLDARIKTATADLIQWRDKLGWSNRMFTRGYLSANQKLNDETRADKAESDLDKLYKESETLKFDNRRQVLDLENKLAQAELALQVAKETADAKRAQAQAKLTSAELILKQEQWKLDALEQDLRNCKIHAPHDGMVIYFIPESARFGSGNQNAAIEPGAPVKEGQKLMRIPDLSRMVSRVKVNETVVNRLRGDVTAPTGFFHGWDAAIGIGQFSNALASHAVPGTHTSLPAMLPGFISQREYKSDFAHLADEVVEYGMSASVRVPSVERPLAGHVKMVASVASSTDWMSSDVKVYQTVVAIDEHIEGLRPNMSAEVTVKIDERKDVLRLPVQAVLESGGRKFCYVRKGDMVEKKTVKTGLNNYKFVEILDDGSEVKEGDIIVLNARAYAEKVNDLQGGTGQDAAGYMKDRGNRKRGGPNGPGGKAPQGQTPGSRAGSPGKGKPADVSANQPDPAATPRERRGGGARTTN
jgi:multidrug efflux pump subunit AcrA (membrane-fusion protein)